MQNMDLQKLAQKLTQRAELTMQLAELDAEIAASMTLVAASTNTAPADTSGDDDTAARYVGHRTSRIFRHKLTCREQALHCRSHHDFVC